MMQKLNLKSFEKVFDTLTYEDQVTFIEGKKDIIIEGLYGMFDGDDLIRIIHGKNIEDVKHTLSTSKDFRYDNIMNMHIFCWSILGKVKLIDEMNERVGRSISYKEYIGYNDEEDCYHYVDITTKEYRELGKKAHEIEDKYGKPIDFDDEGKTILYDRYTDAEWYLYVSSFDIRPLNDYYR
jgi:hypothetical protein